MQRASTGDRYTMPKCFGAEATHNCRSVGAATLFAIGHSACAQALVDRVGGALLRAPYAWLVTTFAVVFIMITSLSGIAPEVGQGSSLLAAVAAGIAVVNGVLGGFVAPRTVLKEVERERSLAHAQALRWGFSMTPFLLTWVAVAAGAERWALSVGLVVTVLLLVHSARAASRLHVE